MKLISWGFIGCGEVTEKKSGPAFNEIEGSHVEAVMSRSESKARSYAERHHIPKWYTDAQELVDDPNINAIHLQQYLVANAKGDSHGYCSPNNVAEQKT